MKKIETNKAPAAIGPYSQAFISGGFLFTSGQIPIDPRTGLVVGNTVEEQAKALAEEAAAAAEPVVEEEAPAEEAAPAEDVPDAEEAE